MNFNNIEKDFKKKAGKLMIVTILLNVMMIGLLVVGGWWAWNHIISPSFDVPQLQVK